MGTGRTYRRRLKIRINHDHQSRRGNLPASASVRLDRDLLIMVQLEHEKRDFGAACTTQAAAL